MQKACFSCARPFDYVPRTQVEAEMLRKALLVTAPLYEPVVCDACFERSLDGLVRTEDATKVPHYLLGVS